MDFSEERIATHIAMSLERIADALEIIANKEKSFVSLTSGQGMSEEERLNPIESFTGRHIRRVP